MTTLKITELPHTEELAPAAMAEIVGGADKQPAGKPTHIDIMNNVFTFKDGSTWSMDLNGNFHPR